MQDGRFVVPGVLLDCCFAKAIEAPRVNLSGLMDGEGVESTTADMCYVLRETKFSWLQAVQPVSFDDTASQLVLLARAPREDGALVVQGEHVVVSAGQVFDFLQRRDEGRGRLDLVDSIKAQDTIVALRNLLSA